MNKLWNTAWTSTLMILVGVLCGGAVLSLVMRPPAPSMPNDVDYLATIKNATQLGKAVLPFAPESDSFKTTCERFLPIQIEGYKYLFCVVESRDKTGRLLGNMNIACNAQACYANRVLD